LRERVPHRGGYLGIFAIDDAGDFERGLAIETGGGGVCFLGAEEAEVYACCSTSRGSPRRGFLFQACFPKASITAS
jgi:hypothetical protein